MARRWSAALLAGLMAACGGGERGPAPAAPSARVDAFRQAIAQAARRLPQAARPMRVLAGEAAPIASDIDAVDAANQLLTFAERVYPEYFPARETTRIAGGYVYRHYPETGAYLGVREQQVFVMGGPFGAEPLRVGRIYDYIGPVYPAAAALCAQAGATFGTFVSPAAAPGKNAMATLAGCPGPIGNPRWTQVGGPPVEIVSGRTPTISFNAAVGGDYAFEVRFVDANGVERAERVTVPVARGNSRTPGLALRASLSVRMGGKVSVRAWPTLAEGDAVESIVWTQIEGPPVELDTRDSHVALFVAPVVAIDRAIRLRATLRTQAGFTDTDEVLVLVERHDQAAPNDANAVWAGDHVARVHAYRADGPYAAVLAGCTYDSAQFHSGPRANLCTLGTLPFLAQEAADGLPTIEQVMSRVLVTHDWLGRNFETYLRTQDPRGDVRRMLGAVTAIVLGTQIRPSFYYPGTGAIYLDADNFWLTPTERDTVNEAPDFRDAFDEGLQFASLWRYVEGTRSLFEHFDPRQRRERDGTALRNEVTWLMFHELAHALDFLPPSMLPTLDRRRSVWSSLGPRYAARELASDRLSRDFPLTSAVMRELGAVMFHGVTPTAQQQAYTALEVAGHFANDLATDDYNYSTEREDLAMTLEEFLMSRRLDVRRDMAFSDKFDADATGSTIIVRWGQRGRIGEPAIARRLRAIADELVPWVLPGEVDLLAPPTLLRAGESWTANLQPAGAARSAHALRARPSAAEIARAKAERRRMLHHRHIGAKRLPPVDAAMGSRETPSR